MDLATRWAQQEPFQGHGGGGSRLQWVAEGIRSDKMQVANWRQLFIKKKKKKTSAEKGRQKKYGGGLKEGLSLDRREMGTFMSPVGET